MSIGSSVTPPTKQESDGITRDSKMDGGNEIQVPSGKLIAGLCFCRACGASCNSNDMFCAHCGSRLDDLNSS